MRCEPNPARARRTTRSPQADRGISGGVAGPSPSHPNGGLPANRRRFDPAGADRVPLIGQRLCRAACCAPRLGSARADPLTRRDLPANTGRDPREQADLPAEQPSSPQGARFPPAHAHPRRPRHHLLAPPQGPQEPRGLSEPRPIPERPSLVLAVDHRLRESDAFRRTVRSGRRAGGAALVTHLLVGDPADSRRPVRVGFVVGKAVGGAVVRNRVRRRLRHLVRPHLATLPASAELVVRALPGRGEPGQRGTRRRARPLSRTGPPQ